METSHQYANKVGNLQANFLQYSSSNLAWVTSGKSAMWPLSGLLENSGTWYLHVACDSKFYLLIISQSAWQNNASAAEHAYHINLQSY